MSISVQSAKAKRSPTQKAKKVLLYLLQAEGNWVYGYELITKTGYKSGYVYPLLSRLKERGHLISKREVLPEGEVRPQRTMYKLTKPGKSMIYKVLHSTVENSGGIKSKLGKLIHTFRIRLSV